MDVISSADTRERLKEVMDQVVADHQLVVISPHKAGSVVMVSLADWHAIEETMDLLSSPTNALRLKSAIDELNAGDGNPSSFSFWDHPPHFPAASRRVPSSLVEKWMRTLEQYPTISKR